MSRGWNPFPPALRARLPLQEPPVQALRAPWIDAAGIALDVLRLDAMHPLWGGNKAFKLAHVLDAALQAGARRVLSFGGAHSNHLHALAASARALGLATVAIVRGEDGQPPTATLADLAAWGVTLHHVSREEYRKRQDAAWRAAVAQAFQPVHVVPEGGDNDEGFRGCRDLGHWLAAHPRGPWDVIAVACGTGTTLAGLVAGTRCRLLGIAAARDEDGIRARVAARLRQHGSDEAARWQVTAAYAGRGFGRCDAGLVAFMDAFEHSHGIALDPVYTGKLFGAVHALAGSGAFTAGTRVLVVHSGGLQGRRGMATGTVGGS